MIYKLLLPAQWDSLRSAGTFAGSPDDLRDGFIHFSTAEQVKGTAAKHFAAVAELVLAEVDPALLAAALRWEPSRGGALFPHLYAPLPASAIARTWTIRDGKFPNDSPCR